jgi:hypothetical protein
MIKICYENQYGFELKFLDRVFRTILRQPTGNDIIWIYDSGFNFENVTTFLEIYKHLLVKESESILELDLKELAVVQKEVQAMLSKVLVSPQQLLQIVYFCSGKSFPPDWRKLLEEPVEILLAMIEVVKEFPPSI